MGRTGATGEPLRLPDFLVIGAMKSGTTSLFRWLDEQPECTLPRAKEAHFFSHDDVWARGLEWYASLFAHAPPDRLTGEASPSYTHPVRGAVAAERIASVLPDVRLVFVARNPVERLRSHYRHQVQRGRERRPFLEAVAAEGNSYVARSCYHACLGAYLERFPREQICIVRFEDVVEEGAPGWRTVLGHLGLSPRALPAAAHNVTAAKARFTRPLLWLWQRGMVQRASALPRPVRRLGRALLLRRDAAYESRLVESTAPLPPEVTAPVWEDAARLERLLDRHEPLWPKDGS